VKNVLGEVVVHPSLTITIESVLKKDSTDITDEDRTGLGAVVERYARDGVKRFLVTHGTDTMVSSFGLCSLE
jgi:L-asparaginase/Glu-tRNA(Gln) amidotransferase subunit D